MTLLTRLATALAAATIAVAALGLAPQTAAVADPLTDTLRGFDFGSLGPGTTAPSAQVEIKSGSRSVIITRVNPERDSSCITTPGLEVPHRLVNQSRVSFTAEVDARCEGPVRTEAILNFAFDGGDQAAIRMTLYSTRFGIDCESTQFCRETQSYPFNEFELR